MKLVKASVSLALLLLPLAATRVALVAFGQGQLSQPQCFTVRTITA